MTIGNCREYNFLSSLKLIFFLNFLSLYREGKCTEIHTHSVIVTLIYNVKWMRGSGRGSGIIGMMKRETVCLCKEIADILQVSLHPSWFVCEREREWGKKRVREEWVLCVGTGGKNLPLRYSVCRCHSNIHRSLLTTINIHTLFIQTVTFFSFVIIYYFN